MRNYLFGALGALLAVAPAQAEETFKEKIYGDIVLTGQASSSWPLNPPGESFAMVCNLSRDDSAVAIRSGPGSAYEAKRWLNRLAILTVDTRKQRDGQWIAVVDANRSHTIDGKRLSEPKSLAVKGWVNSYYLCDFLD